MQTSVVAIRTHEDRRVLGVWGLVGLGAQVLSVASWLVAGFMQGADYSPLRDQISYMGATSAPHPWVLLVPMGLAGAGTIAFALAGLRRGLAADTRAGQLGPWLLACSALGLGSVSDVFFRLDCHAAVGCTPASTPAVIIHLVMGTVTFLVLVVAPFVMARRLRRVPEWGDLAGPSVATGVLLLVGLAASLVPAVAPIAGLVQRGMALLAAIWIAMLALRLYRRQGETGGPVFEDR